MHMHTDYKDSNYLRDFLKEMFGGITGGILNVFIGHPFDTLRVRIQNCDKTEKESAIKMLKRSI
jgi:hypothetical protein